MRLDKYLADMGLGTRSELKKAIRGGVAQINGVVEKDPEPRYHLRIIYFGMVSL